MSHEGDRTAVLTLEFLYPCNDVVEQFLHFARYIIIVNTSDTPIIEPTMIITGRMLS